MKILIIGIWGGGTALGMRLKKEGHFVKMWIKDDKFQKVGDGFVEKVQDWESNKDWADLIILDDGNLGALSEELKRQGKKVWGGSKWSDEIENDRGKGQDVFKQMGMKIIPHKDFSSVGEALAFVKSSPKRYVVKPDGKASEEKSLTYVGKEENGSDMISVLTNYQTKWGSKINHVEIQEVKLGVEVGISGFFNGTDFVEPIEISFEHKRMYPGDIGPNSGEMGTTMVWQGKRKIYRDSIGKMVPFLKKNNYFGYLDINCIAEGENLWPLEVTSRFGYPTIHLKMETIKGNLGEFMYKISSGKHVNFHISNPYSICVVVATPPYPFESEEMFKKYGEDQEIIFSGSKDGIWPGEVSQENGHWYISGQCGFTVICTGSGKTMREARDLCYKRVNSITIPNSYYRTDIGLKTEENLKTLNKWGYFNP